MTVAAAGTDCRALVAAARAAGEDVDACLELAERYGPAYRYPREISCCGRRREVLSLVGHTLGPAPLAFDETHARRVADLEIYVRQHHAERDLADLGNRLIDRSAR
jgi:hypothetical protein